MVPVPSGSVFHPINELFSNVGVLYSPEVLLTVPETFSEYIAIFVVPVLNVPLLASYVIVLFI